jgi:hypothetical protein
MASTDDFTWNDDPEPTRPPAPKDEWSFEEKSPAPTPKSQQLEPAEHGAQNSATSDPKPPEADRRFDIFTKVVPLGVGQHARYPGKRCLMVGHGAGWHVYVQDILVEKLPETAVPAIRDNHGRHVRFYVLWDHLCVRFDTPRATTIYLVIESGKARQVAVNEYKQALRGNGK